MLALFFIFIFQDTKTTIQILEDKLKSIDSPDTEAIQSAPNLELEIKKLIAGIKDNSVLAQAEELLIAYGKLEKFDKTLKDTKEKNDAKNKEADRKELSDRIAGAKPMTAVLLSWQERNQFSVVKSGQETGEETGTMGIIHQEASGSVAGVVLAFEAPFYYIPTPKTIQPIGGWFGVNMTSGQGNANPQVDLALGFSWAIIPRVGLTKKDAASAHTWSSIESVRILLGALYSEEHQLGFKSPGTGDSQGTRYQVGDPFPLGDSIPVTKDHRFGLSLGLGFRFGGG
jgi:hypothetical protein